MTHEPDTTTVDAWAALSGPPGLAEQVSYVGAGDVLAARLPVRELARATVGVCSLAAAELLALRNATPVPAVRVHEGAVATAFVSERHLRIDGRATTTFAPLSGFWRASDGWVRTHANYPHHRARLLEVLGIADTGDDRALREAVAAELARRPTHWIQETVYAAGGLAVAVTPPDPRAGEPGGAGRAGEHDLHAAARAGQSELAASARAENREPVPAPHTEEREPHAAAIGPGAKGPATTAYPLIEIDPTGESRPHPLPPAALPAAGVRVLDLTRVIAGPVATRTLAFLGADVLRVDSPKLPELPDAHADTGMGKRSTLLDLTDAEDRRTFTGLLDTADVVVLGYRPGFLASLGLDEHLGRRPDLIVAELCAWGWSGPWAARRGFDSLVQAAGGIAMIEADDDGTPGALPAQALDHGTGYLLAAAVLRALTERQRGGGGRRLRFSLAGTASWLMHGIRPAPVEGGGYDPAPWLAETNSPYGHLRHALPPVHYEGAPRTWRTPPPPWGTDLPQWAG